MFDLDHNSKERDASRTVALALETTGDSARAGFEPFITTTEAAALLKIHRETLRKWARAGLVPHIRMGRRVMFRVSQLDLWCRAGYTSAAVRVA